MSSLPMTTDQDLKNIAKKLKIKNYRGFFMRNQSMPPLRQGFYIFNLDDWKNSGTHWTTALVTKKGQDNLYFDSFGFDPPTEIKKFLKSAGDDVLYSTISLQDDKADSCGYWVLNFMHNMQQSKKTPTDAYLDYIHKLYSFDTKDNEKKLKKAFAH